MPMRQPMETTYSQVWDAMTNKVNDKVIVRDVDGAFIPFDEGNMDYQDYLTWAKAGNRLKPAMQPKGAK